MNKLSLNAENLLSVISARFYCLDCSCCATRTCMDWCWQMSGAIVDNRTMDKRSNTKETGENCCSIDIRVHQTLVDSDDDVRFQWRYTCRALGTVFGPPIKNQWIRLIPTAAAREQNQTCRARTHAAVRTVNKFRTLYLTSRITVALPQPIWPSLTLSRWPRSNENLKVNSVFALAPLYCNRDRLWFLIRCCLQ
jgi:hypothetical protein